MKGILKNLIGLCFLFFATSSFSLTDVDKQDLTVNFNINGGFENGLAGYVANPIGSVTLEQSVIHTGKKAGKAILGYNEYFETPTFQIPSGISPAIFFFYKTSGASITSQVFENGTALAPTLTTLAVCASSYCKSNLTSFSYVSTNNYKVRFQNTSVTSATIYIDDISSTTFTGSTLSSGKVWKGSVANIPSEVAPNFSLLEDVVITTPSTGDVLKYNSGTGKWANSGSSAATLSNGKIWQGNVSSVPTEITPTFSLLTDVNLSSLSDAQVLTYNNSTSKWINAAIPTQPKALSALTDTVIATPLNDQALVYETATSKWKNKTISSGASLSALTDTTIATPLNNQVLRYETATSKWKNSNETVAPDSGWLNTTNKVALNNASNYVPEIKSFDKDYSADNFLKTGSFESVSPITCDAGTCAVGTGDFYEGEKSLAVTYSGTSVGIAHYSATNTKLAGRTLYLSCAVKATSDSIKFSSYDGTTKLATTTYPLSAGWVIAEASMYVQSNGYYGFYIEKAATSTNALYVDQCKIVDAAFKSPFVNVITQEAITFTGFMSKDGSNRILFKTRDPDRSNESVLLGETHSGYSIFTVKKKAMVNISVSVYQSTSTLDLVLYHYNAANTLVKASDLTFVTASSAGSTTIPIVAYANAGDYFYAYHTGGTISDLVFTNFTITASSVAENIVTTYQDGTEPVAYTPMFNGAGTVSNVNVFWYREGRFLVAQGSYTNGTTTGVPFRISLPAGYTIDSSLYNTTRIVGTHTLQASSSGANSIVMTAISGASTYVSMSNYGAAASTNNLTEINGNLLFADNAPQSFYFKVPIAGWTSAPKLLALPVGRTNDFSAKFDGSGNTLTKSEDWFNSYTKNSTGVYTLNYTKLGLTTAPAIDITIVSASTVLHWQIISISATSAVFNTFVTGGSATDYPLSVSLHKQQPDYTDPGVHVGAIAGNLVGISGTNSPEILSASYGTTNDSTACSGTPCFIDQVGTGISSITRTSTGSYLLTTAKTYSKLKCTITPLSPSNNAVAFGAGSLRCTNCNSLTFNTAVVSASQVDTWGTIICVGN